MVSRTINTQKKRETISFAVQQRAEGKTQRSNYGWNVLILIKMEVNMKRIVSLFLAVVMMMLATPSLLAATEPNLNAETEYINEISPRDATTTTFWEYEKTPIGADYGDWRDGPSGKGPGTITLSKDVSYTESFSGSIGGSTTNMNATLGFDVGVSRSHGSSYSITPPSGVVYTIIFRAKLMNYNVKQTQIRLNIATGERTVLDVRYAVVGKFIDWEYDYRVGH